MVCDGTSAMIRPFFRGEHVDAMLKRLQKSLQKDGTKLALRRCEYAMTKGERRRQKSASARKRVAKNG